MSSESIIDQKITKEQLQSIRLAVLSMGYLERKPGHWLKPIGYQIFTYHELKNEWSNWFLDAKNVISLWENKQFQHSYSYLDQLKSWECFTRTDAYINGNSEFQLSAIDL